MSKIFVFPELFRFYRCFKMLLISGTKVKTQKTSCFYGTEYFEISKTYITTYLKCWNFLIFDCTMETFFSKNVSKCRLFENCTKVRISSRTLLDLIASPLTLLSLQIFSVSVIIQKFQKNQNL